MQKLLSLLLFLLRSIVSVTFILSGVLKLLDPVGTGLIINEYLTALHLNVLSPASNVFGMTLSTLEFVTGIALLSRLRIRVFSVLALCLLLFFTMVTFFLYKYNPIQDCGCFGEAIHLSNAQTFYKNLILLVCIVPVVLCRKRFNVVSKSVYEWVFLVYHALFGLVLSSCWLHTDPAVEFGDFKVGANLVEKLDQSSGEDPGDVYVYAKNGEEKEFSLDEIPDTTWHFVETRSRQGPGSEEHVFDFAVTDISGSYITDSIVHHEGPVLLFAVHRPDELDEEQWRDIADISDAVSDGDCYVKVLEPGPADMDTVFSEGMTAYCDYRTLLSLSRSNGGVVYVKDGIIAAKYHRGGYTATDLLEVTSADVEHTISKNSALENIRLELLFVIILLNIVVFRYICGLRHGRSVSMK